MSQAKLKSPSAKFTNAEASEIAACLTQPCCHVSTVTLVDGDPSGGDFDRAYPGWIAAFLVEVNKDADDTGMARVTLRKGWVSGCLIKCQMMALFNYIGISAKLEISRKKSKEHVQLMQDSATELRRFSKQLERVKASIKREQDYAVNVMNRPEHLNPFGPILGLIEGCVNTIVEVHALNLEHYSHEELNKIEHAFKKKCMEHVTKTFHQGRSLSLADVVTLAPFMYRAMTGVEPTEEELSYFSVSKMGQQATRFKETKTQNQLTKTGERLESMIPGFNTRVETESMGEMAKEARPISIAVKPEWDTIFLLAGEFDSIYPSKS